MSRYGTVLEPRRGVLARAEAHTSSSSSTSAELSSTGFNANGKPSPPIAADTAQVDDLLGRLEDASDFVAERIGAIPPRAIGCARTTSY